MVGCGDGNEEGCDDGQVKGWAGWAVGCSDGFKVMTFDTRDEQKVAVMVVLKADERAD